ncbi:MAG: arsenate reductase [Planctomycetota bacterium]|jgi:arsenate reductase
MSITIYHNPRCSKSRQTLQLLSEKGLDPQIIDYLNTPPSSEELKLTLGLLGMQARELMRKNESVYAECGLDDETLSEDQLIDAMVANPVLIERPIVLANGKARIGRPPGNVLEIL